MNAKTEDAPRRARLRILTVHTLKVSYVSSERRVALTLNHKSVVGR